MTLSRCALILPRTGEVAPPKSGLPDFGFQMSNSGKPEFDGGDGGGHEVGIIGAIPGLDPTRLAPSARSTLPSRGGINAHHEVIML